MKNSLSLLFLLVVSLILVGCGAKDSTTNEASKNQKVIGITVMTLGNPFFVELTQAAKDHAKQFGYDVVIQNGDGVDKQAKQIEDFVTQGVDAIVIAPRDALAVGAPIKTANAAGIPVFTADTGCDDPSAEVVSNVMSDNYGGGRLAGKAMIEALKGKAGKVLVLDYKRAQSCILRVNGFKDEINEHNQKYPQAKITIAAELPGMAEEETSKKATQDQLNATPELAGVFAINDPSALGAVVALEKANRLKDIPVIGFDGQLIGKEAILKGKIYADPIQFPKEIGVKVVDQAIKYLNGDEVEKEILIPIRLYRQEDAKKDPELQKSSS